MTQDRETLRAVAWQEIFPVLHLFSALRIALHFRLLVLAALALVGTIAGWRVIGELFSDTDHAELLAQIDANRTWPWESTISVTPIGQFLSLETWKREAPLLRAWNSISQPFVEIYRADASLVQWTYWLSCALWSLVIWAFFGGAITRIAAVSFARQENVSWSQVAGFVRPRWPSYFAAPLMPILATFLAALLLAVLGLIARQEVGLLIAGIVWPLALLAGFTIAFLLIGLYFSWPLMWAAISAEGTDAFGALSHAYSYVFQRPLRYLVYGVLATLAGVVGWYLVVMFAHWIVALADWGVSWGSGIERLTEASADQEPGALGGAGIALVEFWNNCFKTLALAYIFSYFWVATTVIYFLLRRQVDGTELDEVHLPDEQALHGLPPLKTGPDGVPEPADEPAPDVK
jgi:hypothetical protein